MRWRRGHPIEDPLVATTVAFMTDGVLARLREHARVVTWSGSERPTRDDLIRLARHADAILCQGGDPMDREVAAACPRLAVVATASAGYDHIELEAMDELGVLVTNTPGVMAESTADVTWALILAAARRVVEADRIVHDGSWVGDGFQLVPGMDVYGQTLGIVGFGTVGQAVARRAAGFGMRLLHYSRQEHPDAVSVQVSLDELLRSADIVSVNVALNAETRGLIGEPQLRAMKPTSILVNTSRGPVVDQAALARALSERWIWAAGLDVTAVEPVPIDDPILSLPNCIILPHVGSATTATRTRMASVATDDLIAALGGSEPTHVVTRRPTQ